MANSKGLKNASLENPNDWEPVQQNNPSDWEEVAPKPESFLGSIGKKGASLAEGVAEAANPLNIPYGLESLGRNIIPGVSSKPEDFYTKPIPVNEMTAQLEAAIHTPFSDQSHADLLDKYRKMGQQFDAEQIDPTYKKAGEIGTAIYSLGQLAKSGSALLGLGDKANVAANEARVASLGGGKAQVQNLMERDKIQELGNYLKDKMGMFTSRKGIANNLDAAEAQAGNQIGDVVNQADAMNAADLPAKASPASAEQLKSLGFKEPIEGALPVRRSRFGKPEEAPSFGGNENQAYLQYNPESNIAQAEPWNRVTGLGAEGETLPPGVENPETFNYTKGPEIIPVEKTAVPKLSENFIDAHDFINSAEDLLSNGNAVEREGAPAVQKVLNNLKNDYKPGEAMSMTEAQDLLGSLGKKAKYDKNVPTETTEAYNKVYQLLRQKQKDAIEALGTSNYMNLKEPFEEGLSNFHLARTANDLVSGKLAREAANRAISPSTGFVTGIGALANASHGGSAAGDIAAGGTFGILNHLFKTYGNQSAASILDLLHGVSKYPTATRALTSTAGVMSPWTLQSGENK